MRKQLIGGLVTVFLFGAIAGSGRAQYTLVDLGLGSVAGITNQGPFSSVPAPPLVSAGGIWDMNENGAVTGAGLLPGNTTAHAFLYSNGVLTDLGLLAGATTSTGIAINDHDEVVGISGSHAFLYSAGTMTDLGTFGGDRAVAYDINNSGQIVGGAQRPGEEFVRAFVYSGGVMTDLGSLGGNEEHFAYAINDAGQIAGYGMTSSGRPHAFLYENGVMSDLGTLTPGNPDAYSGAFAINAQGDVVGYVMKPVQGETGFIYKDGVMRDLSLGYSNRDFHITTAFGINDQGQIVASAYDRNFERHVVLLTPNGEAWGTNPVPLPDSGATAVMLLVALTAVIVASRATRRERRLSPGS